MLPISGDGNIQLTASGSVQDKAPLKPTVNGKLKVVNMDKQQIQQTMAGGVVSTVAAAEPAVTPSP
ncbi:AsmA family protein [compost metagenome]